MRNLIALVLLASASLLTPACGAEPAQPAAADRPTAAKSDETPAETQLAALDEPSTPSTAKPAPAASPSSNWSVDYGKSTLGFTATQAGAEFDGRFEKFDAKIIFDPANLSSASIDVSVDMTSARTGDRQRDIALPGEDLFATKTYPSATFVSKDVEETSAGQYVAHGALTIRDKTKDVDLPFSLEINGNAAHATGGLTLIRTDFGVGQGELASDEWVAFDVDVKVDVTATR